MATATTATYPSPTQAIQHFDCGRDASRLVLGAQRLQQLQPYIFHCLQLSTDRQISSFPLEKLEIHALSDSQAVFTTTTEVQRVHPDMLETIQGICHEYLWKYVIYEDGMVNHRPLEFHFREPDRTPEWGFFDRSEQSQIYVTYKGTARFETTMGQLAQRYPGALPNLS